MKLLISPVYIALLFSFSFSLESYFNSKKSEQQPTRLKVAAYNVEYSKKGTPKEIGESLKSYNFDVVCFSEAPGGNWTQEVAKALGLKYIVVGRYSTAGHKDKYKMIVSKTPLYGYEEVLMADTLHTVTKAYTKIGNQEIALYSVHFPFGWRDQAHIDETTGKVTAFVNHLRENQTKSAIPVLMGDFNFILSAPGYKSPYYEMFTDLGFSATWPNLGIDVKPLGTMVKFKPGERENGGVIDHILYHPKNMKVMEGEIIEMEKPLSDHKPVWAVFELK
jgi:endonuclease/exonuclease/phosphatase family metal-dependent hydrolase